MNQYIRDSKLINNSFRCDYVNLTTASSIADIGKGGLIKLLLFLKIFMNVIRMVCWGKYDLCYITLAPIGYGFWKDSIIVMLLKWFRVKIVIHLHGKGISRKVSESIFKRWWYRSIFHKTKVIHLSPLLINDLEGVVDKSNIYIIPNGIELIECKDSGTKKGLYVLYLSSMDESKGYLDLLFATKILFDKGFTFNVMYVGNWSKDLKTKEQFYRFVKNNSLGRYVRYLGPKYGSEKAKILNEASIFVFPTKNECFPLVILEAMQSGLPVISTSEGAISEIIDDGNTGYIVKPDDIKGLSEKLGLLMKNKELRLKLGENGRKKFMENYSLEHFENNFVSVISRVINDGKY